jgi:hypothetical protein
MMALIKIKEIRMENSNQPPSAGKGSKAIALRKLTGEEKASVNAIHQASFDAHRREQADCHVPIAVVDPALSFLDTGAAKDAASLHSPGVAG